MEIKNEFIPYEQALALKELGLNKNTIVGITIRIQKSSLSGKDYWYAIVQFKNVQTSGEQYIGNYNSYEELMLHLNQFLNEIKNK